jgi:hemerythrin superfamily protein
VSAGARRGIDVNETQPDSGLRYRLRRVARQIGDQHRSIGEIFRVLCCAVADRTKSEAAESLHRYREAVCAHFDLEEEVFFPAIHGLEMTRAHELRDLLRAHEHFRQELDNLADDFEETPPEDFQERLCQLDELLTIHEGVEEKLLRQLNEAAD